MAGNDLPEFMFFTGGLTATAGLPQFRSVYQGHSYTFSSPEAKREFDKHPERYAPFQNGNDIVASNSGNAFVGATPPGRCPDRTFTSHFQRRLAVSAVQHPRQLDCLRNLDQAADRCSVVWVTAD